MARPMPHVDGVEHRYAQVNGFRVHYAEAGTGEPVVLQHGWPQHWWAWRDVIPELAQRYRVICPDLRGFGWSEAPRSGYDKPQLAADLIALLDELGIERVRYAGHDWGAYLGYLAAFEHPQRFERFAPMSVGPPWRTGPPDPRVMLVSLAYQSFVSAPVVGSLAMRRGIPKAMLGRGRAAGEFTQEELETFQRAYDDEAHANASVQVYRTFLTRDLPAAMRGRWNESRLPMPTRLLMGSHDLFRRMLDEDGYGDRADDMRIVIVEGAGHWLMDEKPGDVTRELLDFFA